MAAPYKGNVLLAYSNNSIIQGSTSNDVLIITTNSNQNMLFGSSNTSNIFMKISSNGFVGIGKSNPAYTLDVNGGINFTNGSLQQNGTYYGSLWANNSSNVYIIGSNLGINTSTASEGFELRGLNAKVGCNMYIMSNIGVGKSNPTYTLDVVGGINCTTGLYQNGVAYVGASTTSYQMFNNTSNLSTVGSNSANFTVGAGSKLLIASYALWASNITQAQTTFNIFSSASNTWVASNVSFDPIPIANLPIQQSYEMIIPNSTLGPGTYYVQFSTNKNSSAINTSNCYMNCTLINFPV